MFFLNKISYEYLDLKPKCWRHSFLKAQKLLPKTESLQKLRKELFDFTLNFSTKFLLEHKKRLARRANRF